MSKIQLGDINTTGQPDNKTVSTVSGELVFTDLPVVPVSRIRFGGGYSTILNNEVLIRFVVPSTLTLTANFSDWVARISGTMPSSSVTIVVAQNGSTIGSLTIAATTGTTTFATVGGTSKTVTAGQEITFVADATFESEAALTIVSITGVGTI